jgi:hypothetical protein
MKKMDTKPLTTTKLINFTNEPSEAHKKIPQRRIMEEITEKIMEKLLDMVN